MTVPARFFQKQGIFHYFRAFKTEILHIYSLIGQILKQLFPSVSSTSWDSCITIFFIGTVGYCLPSITGKRYLKGKFKLPLTAAGESANVSCPYGPRDTHAQSMCVESVSGARWKFFNNDDCNYKSRMTRAFRRLAKVRITGFCYK